MIGMPAYALGHESSRRGTRSPYDDEYVRSTNYKEKSKVELTLVIISHSSARTDKRPLLD